MERCLAQVGIHAVLPADGQLLEPDDASPRLQELKRVNVLVAQREQLGLVCRAFGAAESMRKQDETAVQSPAHSQQQEASSHMYTQSQQQSQDAAAPQKHTGSEQQNQAALAAQICTISEQQKQPGVGPASYATSQEATVEKVIVEKTELQPQRLSVSQQQALLRKRTGKAPRTRLELILQVAKNRKEAAAQDLLEQKPHDDASAS